MVKNVWSPYPLQIRASQFLDESIEERFTNSLLNFARIIDLLKLFQISPDAAILHVLFGQISG